jgi:hypothetical protein
MIVVAVKRPIRTSASPVRVSRTPHHHIPFKMSSTHQHIDAVFATTNLAANGSAESLALNLAALGAADLICISEPGRPPPDAVLSQFHSLRTRRSASTHRGGVLLLCRKTRFLMEPIPLPAPAATDVQLVAARVLSDGLPKFICLGVYASCVDDSAANAIAIVSCISAAYLSLAAAALPVIIMGDFNARAGAFGDDITTSRGSRLANFCVEQNLQVIAASTHNKGGFLDLIILPANIPASSPETRMMARSDHRALLVDIDPSPSRRSSIWTTRRIYPQQLDEEKFLRALESGLVGKSGTLHGREQRLLHAVNAALDATGASWRRVRKPLLAPAPTVEDIVHAAHRSPWGAVSLLRKQSPLLAPLISPAALLRIFGKEGKQKSHGDAPPTRLSPVLPIPVSIEEFRSAVDANRLAACQDDDGLDARTMRLASKSDRFCVVFCDLLNTCLREGDLPSRWKDLTIQAIPKPPKALAPGANPAPPGADMRPIYICSIFAKTADRIFDRRLKHTWQPHVNQLGYRTGIPQETATLSLLQKCLPATRTPENGAKFTRALLIAADFTDAFPSVPVKAIIEGYRLGGASTADIAMRIASLTSRRVRVKHDGRYSKFEPIDDGTSQGFVSGSTDFSAASYTLLRRLEAWECDRRGVAMVADDLSAYIVASGSSLDTVRADLIIGAQAFFRIVSEWAAEYGVPISNKTQALYISPPTAHTEEWTHAFRCGTVRVLPATTGDIRILGVRFDAKLTMASAVEHVRAQHARALLAILPLLQCLKLEDRKKIYEALALCHVSRIAPILLSLGAAQSAPCWKLLDSLIAQGARAVTTATATCSSQLAILEAGFSNSYAMAASESARLEAKMRTIFSGLPLRNLGHAVSFLSVCPLPPVPLDGVCVDRPLQHPSEAAAIARHLSVHPAPTHSPAERTQLKRGQNVTAVKQAANARVMYAASGSRLLSTDGSVRWKGSSTVGGAAAVVFDEADPHYELAAKMCHAGRYACSYTAKLHGLRSAIALLHALPPSPGSRCTVLVDSQSALSALALGLWQRDSRCASLVQDFVHAARHGGYHIALRFVYSHCDLRPADAADHYAGLASRRGDDYDGPLWHRDVARCSVRDFLEALYLDSISGTLRDVPRGPGGTRSRWSSAKFASWTEADKRFLCQLRTNAAPRLGGHLIDVPHRCPRCQTWTSRGDRHSQSMVQHLFKCRVTRLRRRTFRVRTIADLWKRPRNTIDYVMSEFISFAPPPLFTT